MTTVLFDGVEPIRQHSDDAGLDLVFAPSGDDPIEACVIAPGARALIPTGTFLGLEAPMAALIAPRSGLAYHHGVTVLNSPGVIDAGFRGEIKVLLLNTGPQPFVINPGDRIAQLLLVNIEPARLVRIDHPGQLSPTLRGEGGFGSTGVSS